MAAPDHPLGGGTLPRTTLRARIVDAIDELDALRCTDHAARDAMLVVRLTRHTLHGWWLPALDG